MVSNIVSQGSRFSYFSLYNTGLQKDIQVVALYAVHEKQFF